MYSCMSESDNWQFSTGDVIREKHAKPSPVPGVSESPKSEYHIERKLRQERDGERFYHVEKAEGGHHLYSAATVEGQYEVIDVSESDAFEENQSIGPKGGV